MLKQILLTLAGLWSANGLTAAKYEQLSGLDNAPKLSFDGMWFIGKVVSVYDGDTCQVVFNVDGDFVKFPVRVTGIDTPERKGTLKEFGTEVGVKTREMIDGKIVYLKAGAFEKYGRLLGGVYACLPEGDTVNISELLIAQKMAKPYDGGTKNTFTQEDYDAYKQHIQNVALPTFVDCPNQLPS